jgi:regulator of cell morphogenesis and NO signaling
MEELEQEVGKIVVVIPAAVTVFEKFGIRFYDSAPVSLGDAVLRAGAPVKEVLKGLREASAKMDGKHGRWDQVPLVALIRYVLENHHEWERNQVLKIQTRLDKAVDSSSARVAVWKDIQKIYKTMAHRFLVHLRKEEKSLFPPFMHELAPGPAHAIRVAAAKRLIPLTRQLEREHDEFLVDWEKIMALTKGFEAFEGSRKEEQDLLVALTHFERYQHQHIHKENRILFEKIRSLGS